MRAAAIFCLLLASCREEPLPEMTRLGAWQLTDQDGHAFGSDALRGKVWVADFVFTSCPDVCPLLSTQMGNLHRRVADPNVRFVSISVDPEHDTPERLREYATRYDADERWHFLTGTDEEVRGVVIDRFRHHVGDPTENEGRTTIMHGVRFVLVDQSGIVRGHYETDRAGMDQLERDIARLLEDG